MDLIEQIVKNVIKKLDESGFVIDTDKLHDKKIVNNFDTSLNADNPPEGVKVGMDTTVIKNGKLNYKTYKLEHSGVFVYSLYTTHDDTVIHSIRRRLTTNDDTDRGSRDTYNTKNNMMTGNNESLNFRDFYDRTGQYAAALLRMKNILNVDIITCPESTSHTTTRIMVAFIKHWGNKNLIFSKNSFKKNRSGNIELVMTDKEKLDYFTGGGPNDIKNRHKIYQDTLKIINNYNTGANQNISIGKINNELRKYVRKFFVYSDYLRRDLRKIDKANNEVNIVVFDDNTGTGSTLDSVCSMLQRDGYVNIHCIVLSNFKDNYEKNKQGIQPVNTP